MESSLFGGRYSTHINMRWEWRGSHSQRYSWGCGGLRAVHGVRNRVFDEESNSSTRARLRSVILEEGATRETYLGLRDVLREESFCLADYGWFVSGNLYGTFCKV